MLQVVTELEKREEPVTAMELVKEIYKVGWLVVSRISIIHAHSTARNGH